MLINCSEQKYSLTDPDKILFDMMYSWIIQLFVAYLFTKYFAEPCCMNCSIYIQSIMGLCVIMAAISTFNTFSNERDEYNPFEKDCFKTFGKCFQ